MTASGAADVGTVGGEAPGAVPRKQLRLAPDTSAGLVSSHREVRGSPGQPRCAARKAVAFYRSRIAYWERKMGAGTSIKRPATAPCPRYLAKVLRGKAAAARAKYVRWREYHYNWEAWLPAKWRRIGACETGYGRQPGSWTWDSGRYVSAFGIYRPAYAQFAGYIGQLSWDETRSRLRRLPTPREQYNVASAIANRFGYGAWGCGGA